MVTTRSSSRSSAKQRVNYSESDQDKDFRQRMKGANSRPLSTSSPRKRKQSERGDDSEYQPNSDREEWEPKPKRRKINNRRKLRMNHIDTPMPQRRSMRLATKESLLQRTAGIHDDLRSMMAIEAMPSNGASKPVERRLLHSAHSVGDAQLDSDESIGRNTRSLSARNAPNSRNSRANRGGTHSKHNGHGHSNGMSHGGFALRRSSRIRGKQSSTHSEPEHSGNGRRVHAGSAEEDDLRENPPPKDSDYDDNAFEKDLQNEQIEKEQPNDIALHEDSDYLSEDRAPRRRSSRLSKKNQVHYYNDGEAIIGPRRDPMPSEQGVAARSGSNTLSVPFEAEQRDKSKSLPLSLRRPKRQRRKPVDHYAETQWEEYHRRQERRSSLRSKKAVDYRESPCSSEEESSAGGTTVTTSASSRSRSQRAYRRRRRTNRRKKKKQRRRGYESSSSLSSSSVSTDTLMEIREERRIRRERKKIRPIEMHDLGLYHEAMAPNLAAKGKKSKEGPADISPLDVDLSVDWDCVGGLSHHVAKLKEMVLLPLLYPTEFARFRMSSPRGVLFHGPPGTGKTLVARVLAAQCSKGSGSRKAVAFYMRKGADCLSKWVGEAERQLRLLFEEAARNQPAVIFFDELDGLAPVRSSRQDQIHSSIVSTLLALMDGLDARGQIIVIGATNRPDAIDPALRRPGRFDRELCFNLPSKAARREILKIHTKSWQHTRCQLDDATLTFLSEQSVGYCGADLEALCREGFLAAVRRTFPQIYHSNVRLLIDTERLAVQREDFEKALANITPSAQRSSLVFARALPKLLRPLLEGQLQRIRSDIEAIFALRKQGDGAARVHSQHYRYLIHGGGDQFGQSHLGPAVLHLLEEHPLYSLDLATLYGDSTTKCADEAILRIFKESQRNTPSVLYWPHIERWWAAAHGVLRTSISLLIGDIANDTPLLIVATSNAAMANLDDDLVALFEKFAFHDAERDISEPQRRAFWQQMVGFMEERPRRTAKTIEQFPSLPIAELPPPPTATAAAAAAAAAGNDPTATTNSADKADGGVVDSVGLIEKDRMDCVSLRVYIRSVCNRLCKHFKNFIDQMKEGDAVVVNNLSLFEIRQRNNERAVPTVRAFLEDIDLLVQNVKDSAHSDSLKARQFVNEAAHLQDQALSMMSQVNRDLVRHCDRMAAHREHGAAKKKRRVSFAESGAADTDTDTASAPLTDTASARNERRSSLRNGGPRRSDKAEREEEDAMNVDDADADDDDDDDGGDDDDDDDVDGDGDGDGDGEVDGAAGSDGAGGGDAEEEGEEEDDGRTVTINKRKVGALVTRLVEVTKGYSVQEMEDKMFNVLRIVHQHSNRWDRTEMVEELDGHIADYFKRKVDA